MSSPFASHATACLSYHKGYPFVKHFSKLFKSFLKSFSIVRDRGSFFRFPCDSLSIISLSKNKVNCFSPFFVIFLRFFIFPSNAQYLVPSKHKKHNFGRKSQNRFHLPRARQAFFLPFPENHGTIYTL